MNTLEYKGYRGSVEYSASDEVLFGKVIGIRSLVSYEGESLSELQEDFRGAVDDYLDLCKEKGIEPEKEYKGTFNVRISPELHRTLALIAGAKNQTLNATVENALQEYVKMENI